MSRAARDAAVTLAALALILAWEASGADVAVAHLYGGTGGFLWRGVWWARDVLHDGGRLLSGLALAAFALHAAWPARRGPPRAQRLYWLGVAIACLLLVPTLKRYSRTSCPWDLAPFGGRASYVPHWVTNLYDGGPGHCFPSGHAVAAFAFLALYFLWRDHHPARARWALTSVVALGLLFGWTQTARGAHFPSHVMWSAWLCWAGCAVAAWHARSRPAWAFAGSSARERAEAVPAGRPDAGPPCLLPTRAWRARPPSTGPRPPPARRPW